MTKKTTQQLLSYCPVIEDFGSKNPNSCKSKGKPADPFNCEKHGYFRQGDGFIVKVEPKDFPALKISA